MQRFFIFLLTLFAFGAIQAESPTTILIKEKGTEQPLPGAVVHYIPNGETTEALHSVSDLKGKAELSFKNGHRYKCNISFMGYIPLDTTLCTSSSTIEIFLESDVLQLHELVVTGTRTLRPIKEAPVTTLVIDAKALANAGYGNLQQVLQQQTPGLNIQKVGFGNEISMQGLDARHVLFLIDGERMTGDMAGNLDYERFNIHGIDRIEVVKGASSTLYGSRATGAVINLITKKTNRPFDIKAGVRYGMMNENNFPDADPSDFNYMYEKNADRQNVQSWLSAGFHLGDVTSQTDVWYSSSDAFFLYQAENDVKKYTAQANSFLSADTIVTSAAERPPMGIEGKEHVSVTQKIYYEPMENLSIMAYGSAFFMNSYDLIQDLTFTQSQDYTAGIKARYDIKDWFSITASFHSDFYDRYKRHERIDHRTKVYDSRILQPRVIIESNYFKNHNIILGVEHISDDLTSDRFVNNVMTTRSLRETEYFLQEEWNISKQWTLSAGVRTNYSRAFGLMGMPKIAAKYSPSKNWTLRSNLSMGYRSPSIKELFFNWDNLGMFFIRGNENLKPERNKYASLNAEYSNAVLNISATAYGNWFTDKIEGIWHVYDMQYNFEYENLSSQRLLGIEFVGRWRIIDALSLNATYSYVNVSKHNGLQINSSSPHAATASIDYAFNAKNYRLNVNFSSSIMGSKKFDVQDRLVMKQWNDDKGKYENISHDAFFRCELPAYALCNLTISQTIYNQYKITLGVDNIFNYKPKTLGSGITMFNVPATTGARAFAQFEFVF